jgi:hypothetical protein
MGITPIGPLAMLPLSRGTGVDGEPVPMARVERSARTEDETYSPTKEESGFQSQGRESGSEAGDSEFAAEVQPEDWEDSVKEPSFSFSEASAAKISFFA